MLKTLFNFAQFDAASARLTKSKNAGAKESQFHVSTQFDLLLSIPEDIFMRSRMAVKLPWMGIFLVLSSCAVLFPDRTAPKSKDYIVSTPDSPWHKLATSDDPNSTDAMKADMAYENPETGAIISLNSICRKYSPSSLDVLTNNLVRGIGNREVVKRSEIKLADAPALDTVFSGLVDNVHLNIRTVVMVKNSCSYDFIYVTVPERDARNAGAFDRFLASFRTNE